MKYIKRLPIWVFVLIGLFVLWFYWFQLRPANIRSECANHTQENLSNSGLSLSQLNWQRKYNLVYESCVHRNGL